MNSERLKVLALAGVFLMNGSIAAGAWAESAQALQATTTHAMTTSTVPVLHRSIVFDAEFDRFTSALEKILGRFPSGVQETSSRGHR